MVAPIRDLGNKSAFSSSNTHSHQDYQLPAVFLPYYIGMDNKFVGSSPDNFKEVRGRTISSKSKISRNSSMSSTISLVAYHMRMEHYNAMSEDIDIDSHELSYETTQEKAIQISNVANNNNNMATTMQQCISNESPNILTTYIDDTVINISLPYDPNAPKKPNLWDSSFHPILLHDSMEYLASDAKNIKDSLAFIAKYIGNKQIDLAKSNDLKDFKGIGKAI